MNNADLEKKVKHLVHSLRYEKGFVCAVDVLQLLGYLSKKDYEDWRFGKVEYLEKACQINLKKLSLIYKLMRKYAVELHLEESWTGYNRYGKGEKTRLRFSKSGDAMNEKRYATHYVDKNRMKIVKENKEEKQRTILILDKVLPLP
ncbi:MAG: hypothetical protein AMXMBFR48_26990 [Ignavibacteriales bacterium]